MFEYIRFLLKRIVLAFMLLYSYNMMTMDFGLSIGINEYSVAIITVLGIKGLIMIITVKLFI